MKEVADDARNKEEMLKHLVSAPLIAATHISIVYSIHVHSIKKFKSRFQYLILIHFVYGTQNAEYTSMKKDEKRSAYTKRMMEIMSSIKKQRDEIEKVISNLGLKTWKELL